MAALAPLLVAWVAVGAVLSVIDIREHRLPNRIVMPMYAVVAFGLGLAGFLGGQWHVVRSLESSGLWLAVIGMVWLVSSGRAMGFGDVKLAPLLGATLGWLNWDAAILGLMTCWLLGGVWSLVLLVTGRVRLGSSIAFGPFMFLGLGCGLLLGSGFGMAASGL
ncbi:MAG: prepilin peptidase [Actinomycetota bacterium]|nr:prepilin peptidase [Actinomycetota bacterium]